MCRYEPLGSLLVADDQPNDATAPTNTFDEEAREFLNLVADSIVAVLHEPTALGLAESEAVEMASAFLDDALETLRSVLFSLSGNDSCRSQLVFFATGCRDSENHRESDLISGGAKSSPSVLILLACRSHLCPTAL